MYSAPRIEKRPLRLLDEMSLKIKKKPISIYCISLRSIDFKRNISHYRNYSNDLMKSWEKRVTNQDEQPQKQKSCGSGSIQKCKKCGSSNTSTIQIEEDGHISQMIWCEDCAKREFGERKFDDEGYG